MIVVFVIMFDESSNFVPLQKVRASRKSSVLITSVLAAVCTAVIGFVIIWNVWNLLLVDQPSSIILNNPAPPPIERAEISAAEILRVVKNIERKANPDEKNAPNCVICLTEKAEFVVIPCGHLCYCKDCSSSPQNVCPMCRRRVSKLKKVFY